jgi:hypothetical protein
MVGSVWGVGGRTYWLDRCGERGFRLGLTHTANSIFHFDKQTKKGRQKEALARFLRDELLLYQTILLKND